MTGEKWEPISTDDLPALIERTLALSEVGTFRYRLDGTVVYMDAGLVRILDLDDRYPDPALITGKKLKDLFIYESPEGGLRDLVLKQGRIRNYEFKCRTLNGDLRWSLHEAFTVRDPATGEICIQVVARNITELKLKEAKLEEANRELAALRDSLERQVAERTMALKRTNEELQQEVALHTQLDATLRDSEERFRILAESALVGVYILRRGCYSYVNPAMARIFGYTVEEMIGMTPDVIVDPLAHEMVAENIRRRIDGEVKSMNYPVLCRRKDGSSLEVEVFGSRMEVNGEAWLVGTLMDITERRQAEQALRESELRYRGLFDNASDAILLLADGRFLDCNAGALRMYGVTRERLVGASPVQFSPAEQPDGQASEPAAMHWIRAAMEVGPQTFEWEHQRGDGSPFTAEVSLNRLDLAGGPYLQAIVRDITERKAAERLLRENEVRFRAISEHSLTGIYIVQDGVLTYVNPTLAETFGYEVGELHGASPLLLIQPEDHDLVRENIRKRVSGEVEAMHYAFRGRRKDGSTVFCEVMGSRFDWAGRPAVIGNIIDVTERRRAEQQLRDSEMRYRALFEAANDAIMLFAEGQWVDCNAGALKVFGCRRDQILGAHPMRFSPAVQPDGTSSDAEAGRRIGLAYAGEPQRFEWEHCRADGTTFAAEVSLDRVDLAGKPHILAIVRDVDARKRAELAMKDSEERFRSMVEVSPSGIVIHEDGRITYANPAAAAILGATGSEQLVGRLAADFVHPDYQAATRERLQRVKVTGKTDPLMGTVYLRVDGTPVEVESAGMPISVGERISMLVLFNDISERKRAEEKLRASETQYRVLFDQMISGLLVLEVILDDHGKPCDHRFLYANPAFEALTGLKVSEQIGKTRDELDIGWPPDIREKLYRVAMTGESIHYERFNESVGRYYETHVFAPQHGQFAFSFTEITERKAAEEELRKLSRAVEQAQASIVIADLNAEIEYVNEAFVRRTGYSREEVVGKNPRFLNSGQTPRATYDELWQALTNGETWSGEFINRKKDGSTYVEAAVISPLRRPDGYITHYVAVKEDITEEKRLLRELEMHRDHLVELVDARTRELVEAREQAEAANQAKSAFLAMMSHEIRTPLNGVIAMAEMLALHPLAPDDLDAARTIQRSAHTLMAVINDVLDFSKIEAGKLELEVADLSLRQVASDVRVSLQPVADASEVSLDIEVDAALPPFVRGDATRVRQVVMNLVGNAIKFSRGRPDVRGQVSVHFGRPDDNWPGVVIRVSDNGIGMTEETIGRLFTSFTQAERSTTRRYGGTGLGLAICKRLTDLMDGTIQVSSELGRGSTFIVSLPLQVSSASSEAPVDRPGAGTTARSVMRDVPLTTDEARRLGRLILVAEDDTMNQKVVLRQLGMIGYAGEIAPDGGEALRRWRQGGYAMLLTDLHMPNMDGYELAAAIRAEEPPGVHLPIIALTANALHGEAERVTSIGMDGYLTKPVPLAVLRDALDRWIAPTPEAT